MIKPMKFQVLTISQIPSPAELRHDIERELLQNFSAKESGYRNEIHRLTVECKDRETLIQQHDKNMDAAKVRCEEARNLAQVVQSKLEVTRKEKMETEARLEALQGTAQSETYDAAEIDGLKKCLQENADELHKKTEELAKLEHARTDLEARNTNLQIAWEQQTAEIAQDSSVIDRLRQETDAELRKEQDKSNATIDLAQIQTRRAICRRSLSRRNFLSPS
jgi:chromosome segregation ATPase